MFSHQELELHLLGNQHQPASIFRIANCLQKGQSWVVKVVISWEVGNQSSSELCWSILQESSFVGLPPLSKIRHGRLVELHLFCLPKKVTAAGQACNPEQQMTVSNAWELDSCMITGSDKHEGKNKSKIIKYIWVSWGLFCSKHMQTWGNIEWEGGPQGERANPAVHISRNQNYQHSPSSFRIGEIQFPSHQNQHQSLIIHHQSSITNYPSSIIHHQSPITHHPSSIIHHPSSIIHHHHCLIQYLSRLCVCTAKHPSNLCRRIHLYLRHGIGIYDLC